jgi:hypothetical protein
MKVRAKHKSIRSALAAGVVLATAVAAASNPGALCVGERDITAAIGTTLEHLPRYGVFDGLAFHLECGVVALEGYSYTPGVGAAAAAAVKALPGVGGVTDSVKRLPTSPSDDRIRWITFYEIFTDDVLSRYAPGGASGARFDAFQFGGFPGSQPAGYLIHIVVREGRTALVGAVASAADKELAEARAREVGGVSSVDNQLMVGPAEW